MFERPNKFYYKIFIVGSLIIFILFYLLMLVLSRQIFPQKNFVKNENLRGQSVSSDPFLIHLTDEKIKEPIIDGGDPVIGGETALKLIYFSDFTCDYCLEQKEQIEKVLDKYSGKVSLVWKDYPEGDFDSESWRLAIAGRCAFEQGRFKDYSRALAMTNIEPMADKLTGLAAELGLNDNVFKSCLSDDEVKINILDNIKEAGDLGINGIPFIFVGDKGFLGKMSVAELEEMIEKELSL